MREDFSLKEMILYGFTMGFTFSYLALKHLSYGIIVWGQYIAYAIIMLAVCMGVCFLLNLKLNRVIKNFDKQAYIGVEHLRNRMEILDAVVFLDILLDSLIEMPMLFDPMRGPDNIFTSPFLWYFILCVVMEVVSIRLIGKTFKARKVIGRLENPLRAQNADPFAYLKESTDTNSEAANNTELMLSKLPEEELVSEEAEQEWRKCPNCGSENPPQLQQCVFCGGELGEKENGSNV
ncbi:MAG: zinc ribbon domain-containing protein [Oscillospiraceae bacterium]|nr:zinc ribbon domain-containing protein [Oscillospiraceae bacterium]